MDSSFITDYCGDGIRVDGNGHSVLVIASESDDRQSVVIDYTNDEAALLALALLEAAEVDADEPSLALEELRILVASFDEPESDAPEDDSHDVLAGFSEALEIFVRDIIAKSMFGADYAELPTVYKTLVDLETSSRLA